MAKRKITLEFEVQEPKNKEDYGEWSTILRTSAFNAVEKYIGQELKLQEPQEVAFTDRIFGYIFNIPGRICRFIKNYCINKG